MVQSVVFTDWDGTVTLQDSNDYMTDHYGFGGAERKRLGKLMLEEKLSFRDGFDVMLKSISANGHSLDECIELLLANIKLDPGFRGFYEWCKSHSIPLYVISSGMQPVIEALLAKLVGTDAADYIEIISNGVKIDPNDPTKWEIVYRDSTPFGHNKAASIEKVDSKFTTDPTKFFCGDGVSDLSASTVCDLLFARNGKDLVTYCTSHDIPYCGYNSFDDIQKNVNAVHSKQTTIQQIYNA